MADLSDIQAAQSVKVVGAGSTGAETNPLAIDANQSAQTTVRDPSSGAGVTTTLIGAKQCLDVNAQLSSGQLVPTITNKLRIRLSVAATTLPATNAFVTLYTRTGTGLFFGFQADFNSQNVNVRMTLDSGVIFTLKIADVKLMQFNDTSTTRVQSGAFLTTIGNTFDFSSRFAIPYTTSVLIEAAATDGTAHTNNNYIVFQTEDT